MTSDEKLDKLYNCILTLCETVDSLVKKLERYEPLLERYERAANANSMFQARRAMRGN